MKVQMIAQVSGTRNGADWPLAGGVIDLPDLEAQELISAGLAKAPEQEIEMATSTGAETADVKRRPVRRGLTTKDL